MIVGPKFEGLGGLVSLLYPSLCTVCVLAELLSEQMSVQYQPWLERVRYTTTQTTLDRAERMENLHNAFRLRKNADVRRLDVLLIDNVLTTGSTLSECARILKRAGALSVHAATAARA